MTPLPAPATVDLPAAIQIPTLLATIDLCATPPIGERLLVRTGCAFGWATTVVLFCSLG